MKKPLLIKLAEKQDDSSSKLDDNSAQSGKQPEGATSYALTAIPALPIIGYNALISTNDPARLIGGTLGATGGYFAANLMRNALLGQNPPADDKLMKIVNDMLAGANVGSGAALGRALGGAIAGRRPLSREDLMQFLLMPSLGGMSGAAIGSGEVLLRNRPQL